MRFLSLLLLVPIVSVAQAPVPPPGRPYLFVLDLQGTALDEFPSSVKALSGVMTVVDKNGQHMLKASSPSEFLITLPQVLPADFTIELDVIPKSCCAPDDIMLEGTPTMNRGPASAQLTWQPERLSAVGGGEMYQAAMPADLAAATPGNLTRLVWEFSGPTIKHYTNGRRLYTLEKQFARGRVLRVWLGGADDADNALYLASFRIGLGAASPSVIAGAEGSGVDRSTAPAAPASDPAISSQSQGQVGSANRVVSNVAVTVGTGGPLVTWDRVGGASSYTVKRSKIDDATCCNGTSPALSGPPWQDGPLPVAGTYVFQVTATTPAGLATGQAQFVQFKSAGGQIATVAPAPGPPAPSPPSNPAVNSGISGVSSGGATPNSAIKKFLPTPPRVITLSGYAAAGIWGQAVPRTVELPGFVATGGFASIAPHNLAISAATSPTVAPRTVVLTGFAASGSFPTVGPRIVTLVGWSAIGANP
jgi:hypothetical protein